MVTLVLVDSRIRKMCRFCSDLTEDCVSMHEFGSKDQLYQISMT